MTEIRSNGRLMFVLGAALLSIGLALTVAAVGAVGIVVAVVGFAVLLLGWWNASYVGDGRRPRADG
jgi:hypothetical protein